MDWNKGKLFEISNNYWTSCTLHTGVKLDIFTLIGDGEKSSQDIAAAIQASGRGTSALLNALTAMGLLVKTEDRFANTNFSGQFLSRDSPEYAGFILMHQHHLMASWTNLSESVLAGHPGRSSVASPDTESEREHFLMGMLNTSGAMAPMYAETLDLSGCTRLLDLGGGPGIFAIHFCLNNPDLTATVFDLPATRAFAEKTIAGHHLSERIRFLGGNYLDEHADLGGTYDVAWLSLILHEEGPEDTAAIVAKAVNALDPGARIFIHEWLLDDTLAGPMFPALFALNMLVSTENGRTYSEGQIRKMLARCGIVDVERLDSPGPGGNGILAGRKP